MAREEKVCLELEQEKIRLTELPYNDIEFMRHVLCRAEGPLKCYVTLSPWKFDTHLRGFAKKKIPKIRVYYGSGWVGLVLTLNFFWGKSSQNSSKPVLIFWSSIKKSL